MYSHTRKHNKLQASLQTQEAEHVELDASNPVRSCYGQSLERVNDYEK
jgi:hypothetical protein